MDRPGHTAFDAERRAEALLRQGGEDGALDQARTEKSPRRNEDREPDREERTPGHGLEADMRGARSRRRFVERRHAVDARAC